MPQILNPIVKDIGGARVEADLSLRWSSVFEYEEEELRIA